MRRAAVAGFLLMITEAMVGAGLVIFEMVAGNTSTARGLWMATHLMNTFALLAALGLVAWRSRSLTDVELDPHVRPFPTSFRPALAIGLASILVVAMAGAIVALGDTLFPASSLARGDGPGPFAHGPPVRAPARLASRPRGGGGGVPAGGAGHHRQPRSGGTAARAGDAGRGASCWRRWASVSSTSPCWPRPSLQILHLLLADLLWLSLVVLSAAIRERRAQFYRRPASITPLAQPTADMDLIGQG